MPCYIYAEAAKAAACPRDQYRALRNAGIILQPRQLVASALARQCDLHDGPTAIGFGGARGGGKSHWMVAQIAEDCLRYTGLKCLILRKVGKSNKENFNDLRLKVLKRVKCKYVRQQAILRFRSGSNILLGHFQNEADIDAYLGLEYDVIGVEEATTLSHSKYIAIRTCCRTSKPGWRPRMYSTTNPGGVGHAWYREMFVDPAAAGILGNTRFVRATIDDNHYVNVDYRAVLDELTGWKKRAWRYGDWDIAAGQFFTTFRRDVHVLPGKDLSGIRRWWCAIDYGFHHYTVVYLFAQDGDGNVFVVHEHAQRQWPVPLHAQAIRAMLARYCLKPLSLHSFVGGADLFSRESNGATVADQYLAEGIRITAANDDRVAGAAMVLRLLGDTNAKVPRNGGAGDSNPVCVPPRLFILQHCTRLIACLPILEHSERNPEDVKKVDVDENGSGGDDAYDACRYGLMAAFQRSERTIYDPTVVFNRR